MVEHFSLWRTFLVLAAVLAAATEVGYRLRRWRAGDAPPPADATPSGIVISAVLGLLALLIGFTFSMSIERYDTRRDLVLAEANAIGTVTLRLELLALADFERLRPLLIAYERERLGFYAAGIDEARLAEVHRRTGALQGQIWDEVTALARANAASRVLPLLIESLNQAFDLATARRVAFENHTPRSIVLMLIAYAVIVAFMLSTLIGERRRHQIEIIVLFVLVSLVISLVIDVDAPREGAIRISQAPMALLHDSLVERYGR